MADEGVVMLALETHPISSSAAPSGIRLAVDRASRLAPCSAAAFSVDDRRQAEAWLKEECDRRRHAGRVPRVVLAGHSLGAAQACELAKRLLRREPDIRIELLVTVDAIKSTTLGATTGITTTLLTLNNPIPGKKAYFIAYNDAPAPDGERMIAHTNYYQIYSTLYHGGPMDHAHENHRLEPRPEDIVNHGSADDYAFPYVLADLANAVEGKGGQ